MDGECAEPYQRNDGANQHGTCFSGTAATLRDIQMLTAVPKKPALQLRTDRFY
jgi:hypothetical protein